MLSFSFTLKPETQEIEVNMGPWERFYGKVEGTRTPGDASVMPTRWWNHWFLAFWGWKTVTVFRVPEEAAKQGYRVGFIPESGPAMVKKEMTFDTFFRMKNGHEECTFFAVDEHGVEVPLEIHARTTVDDKTYRHERLH